METVASLAVLLDQRRPDLPSFYSALTSSENEDDEAKDRLAECRRRLDTLDAGIHQANTTRTRLARVLRDLQDARELEIPRTEEKKASVPNLTKKGQEYSDKVRRMEVRSCLFVVRHLGSIASESFPIFEQRKTGRIPQSLQCFVLEKLQDDYEALVRDIKEAERKVSSFQDLPPVGLSRFSHFSSHHQETPVVLLTYLRILPWHGSSSMRPSNTL